MKKAILFLTLLLSFLFTRAQFCDFSAPCHVVPSGLIGWWAGDFDATDLTGNHHGVLISSNPLYAPAGKVCPSFFLNGVSDYVSIPDDPAWSFGLNDFSMELWIQFFQINPGLNSIFPNTLIAQSIDSDQNYWILHTTGDQLKLEIRYVGQTIRTYTPSVPFVFSPGIWYHVAVVRASDTFSFFVDGTLIATTTITGVIMPDVASPLTLGYSFGSFFSSHFSGLLDEASIYNRALGEAEIMGIYQAGCKGKCKYTCPQATISASGPLQLLPGETVILTAYPEGLYYSWSNFEMSRSIEVSTPGLYFVNVICANGCIEQSHPVMVGVCNDPRLEVLLSPDLTISQGETVNLSATATGGTPPYSFLWNNGETVESITVSPGATTTYAVTVTDAFFCTADGSVTVTVTTDCSAFPCGNNKVQICHVPQGNPANAKTLCVSKNSVAAHLAHGDYCGPCLNGKTATAEEEDVPGKETDGFSIEIRPNPLKGSAVMQFISPETAVIKIEIYNVVGTCVATVFNGQVEEGSFNQAEFNAENLAKGLYFYKLTAPETTLTGKMILQ